MYIPSKKISNQEYFAHASIHKEKIESNRKHNEDRMRGIQNKDRIINNRKLAMDEREKLKTQNLISMDKEIDQKMDFIKKNLGLNII